MTTVTAGGVDALLLSAIDYAALFPPAGRTMSETVERYGRHRSGDHRRFLGRLVLPASRLEEFAAATLQPKAARSRPDVEAVWPLSLVVPGDAATSVVLRLERFAARWSHALRLEAVEVAAVPSSEVEAVLAAVPDGTEVFFEVPLDAAMPARLEAIRRAGGKAKIRTGGLVPEAIPSVAQVGEFLVRCHQLELPFKATAGLHHAVRAPHALTYEPDAPRGMMHGFLNVALAAALLAANRIGAADVTRVLTSDATDFDFDDDGAVWRRVGLSPAALAAGRSRFFRSFGSCSFSEPLRDLKELELA